MKINILISSLLLLIMSSCIDFKSKSEKIKLNYNTKSITDWISDTSSPKTECNVVITYDEENFQVIVENLTEGMIDSCDCETISRYDSIIKFRCDCSKMDTVGITEFIIYPESNYSTEIYISHYILLYENVSHQTQAK